MLLRKDFLLTISNIHSSTSSLRCLNKSLGANIHTLYSAIYSNRKSNLLDYEKLVPNIRYNQYQAFQNEAEIDIMHLNKDRNFKENTSRKSFSSSGLQNGSTFQEKVVIGYSRDQMCSLVYDVKNYR